MPEASFDNWTIVFLFAAAQGIFLGSVLLLKRSSNLAPILGIFVLLFSITLVEYVAFWTNYRFYFPHINRISAAFPFLYGSLFYLYIKYFLNGAELSRKSLVHIIPFIAFTFYQIPYYILSAEEKLLILGGRLDIIISDSYLMNVLLAISFLVPFVMIIHMSAYLFKGFKLVRKIESGKINSEAISWLNMLMISFGTFIVCFSAYYIMIHIFEYVLIIDYLISFLMSMCIYGLGYTCLLKPKLAFSGIEEFKKKEKYLNSGLHDSYSKQLKQMLLEMMEGKKLYLNGNLKLSDLAKELGESKHHISQVLNDELETTFSNFVNEYRIDVAKRLLENDSKSLNMYGIAKESGFNNKTTFNLAFKRHTGYTPTQFKNENLNH